MDYSRVIIHSFALYIILHFGKPPTRRTGRQPSFPLTFLSPVFTSVSTEMENVGNSPKCLGTKLAPLRAKAICDARVASRIASVFVVVWLRTVVKDGGEGGEGRERWRRKGIRKEERGISPPESGYSHFRFLCVALSRLPDDSDIFFRLGGKRAANIR